MCLKQTELTASENGKKLLMPPNKAEDSPRLMYQQAYLPVSEVSVKLSAEAVGEFSFPTSCGTS